MNDELQRALIEAAQRPWDKRSYLAKLGDAISQLGNTLTGGAPDESLSGRSYRITVLSPASEPPIFWTLVRFAAEALFWIRDRGNHTQLAFWEDIYRARSRGAVVDNIADAVALQTFGSGDSLADDSNLTPEEAQQ